MDCREGAKARREDSNLVACPAVAGAKLESGDDPPVVRCLHSAEGQGDRTPAYLLISTAFVAKRDAERRRYPTGLTKQ